MKKKSEKLYEEIRDRIAFLEYKPGESLNEDEMVKEFDCSRTPIREAFIKLEAEGFLNRIPKKGTSVTTVSFNDLKEVLQLRKTLYGFLGRLVVNNITSTELDELEVILDNMKEVDKPKKIIKEDLRFHRKLDEAAHNQYITSILHSLDAQAVRIWLFSTNIDNISSELGFEEDFDELIKAIKNKNQEDCITILTKHVEATINYLSNRVAFHV